MVEGRGLGGRVVPLWADCGGGKDRCDLEEPEVDPGPGPEGCGGGEG